MRQLVLRGGQVFLEHVPAPRVEDESVLVRVSHSCVSIGTEISGVRSSSQSIFRRAFRHPAELKKILSMTREHGVRRVYRLIKTRLDAGSAIGYSAAGTIVGVGQGIVDLNVGDRVACAGAQCAHHSEIICVPRNLVVRLPSRVDFIQGATVALGAIAVQGVRRLAPTFGETIVVLGLGVIGQLTAQLLKACGCYVIAIDLNTERIALARELGVDHVFHPDDEAVLEKIYRLTEGYGADGVVITASSSSDTIVSQAFQICRKKGRVVVVGDVGLNIKREDIYKKELDFYISTSYGPGRYDSNYEDEGLDYPLPYIRWTENRNMAEYLRCISDRRVRLEKFLPHVVDIDNAQLAYEKLKSGSDELLVLFRYSAREEVLSNIVEIDRSTSAKSGELCFGLIGAGSFARAVHLPNLEQLCRRARLRGVVSRTGLNALQIAKQFGADYASTDLNKLLEDPKIDALIIATRHNRHASEVLAGLKAGKHVLVEKPLALNRQELEAIAAFYSADPSGPILLTGFNRRFSPCLKRVFDLLLGRSGPMIINYRMNAGYVPTDSWVHGPEGGGRNLGEACHIYDLFTFLTGARSISVSAQAIMPAPGHCGCTDNFVATVKFDDGSVASLTYTALGSKAHPKERMEVYVDGKILLLDDYKSLEVVGARQPGLRLRLADKGQKQELLEFADAILKGLDWPIPLWQQLQATDIALRVDEQIRPGVPPLRSDQP
jgi:predicted dehydrogenase/threonine dehydrogenase-like Zn-dependent dehydrogenase